MAGHRRRPTRRERLFRRFLPLVITSVAILAAIVWASASGGPRRVRTTTSAIVSTTTTTTVATTTTILPPTTTSTTDAGSLPQTGTYPSSSSPRFQAAMRSLFASIVDGTPPTASDAFFPQTAYVQLKAIGGAFSDYQQRLVADYDLDILAAHQLLGTGAPGATLTSVQVPMQYAHWVPSGECENSVGYFEVANTRVVYSEGGVTRSFGIASLISWRGEWYVVHLGAILRPGSGGVVLDPAMGSGSSAPSTTC